jgi:hypothetical protein
MTDLPTWVRDGYGTRAEDFRRIGVMLRQAVEQGDQTRAAELLREYIEMLTELKAYNATAIAIAKS